MSIAMYIVSSIFRLLTVTHGQGSMCIKNYALFMNKHHPSEQELEMKFCKEFTAFSCRVLYICGRYLFVCGKHLTLFAINNVSPKEN